jgi:hypothetical protein
MRRNGPSTITRAQRAVTAASTLISYLEGTERDEDALIVGLLEGVRERARREAKRGRAVVAASVVEVDLARSGSRRSEASIARAHRRHEGSATAAYAARAEHRGGRREAREVLGALYRNPFEGAERHGSPRVRALYRDLRDDYSRGAITNDEFGVFYRSLSGVQTNGDITAWVKDYDHFVRARGW